MCVIDRYVVYSKIPTLLPVYYIGESHDEFVCVNGKPTNLKINAGLHNVSLSSNPEHKGCLWLSLQYANILLLVDVKNLDKNGAPKILNEYKASDR